MAIEEVRDRLNRAAKALEVGGVPYAIVGGNAVAEWVGRVDKAAVRFTRGVYVLLRRAEFERAIAAMEAAGVVYNETSDVHMFLDGPNAGPRDAVHVVFAREIVREGEALPAPDVSDSEPADGFQVLALEALVRTKLTAFQRKDQTHLDDLIDVGLVDSGWLRRFPKPLAERLHALLENRE